MAAHSGASYGSSSRARALSRRRRPIPYRQLPFEYAPAKFCDCGEMMPQWISWSDDNPRRRYRNCKIRSIDGGIGCDKFAWADDVMCKFQRDLVRDLRDAVWNRDDEIARLQSELVHDGLKKNKEQSNELGTQAEEAKMKMKENGGSNLFIMWILSVAFAMYCGVCMASN